MIETVLTSVVIIAIAMGLLSIKLILRKNGKFSSGHIHDSEAMRERGIDCVMKQDKTARLNNRAT